MIDITVHGKPEPAGSKKAFVITDKGKTKARAVVVDANTKSTVWKASVARQALEQYEDAPLEGPLAVAFIFFLTKPKSVKREKPSVRPDLTKLIRAVEDALTGVIWKDDAQIVRQTASKDYTEGESFVRVIINGA